MSDWQAQLSNMKQNAEASKNEAKQGPVDSMGVPHSTAMPVMSSDVAYLSIFDSVSDGGAAFEELYNKAVEAVEKLNATHDFMNLNVHRVMKKEYGLLYSGIAISNTHKRGVVYHTIAVESTGETPAPENVNEYNRHYVVHRAPSIALDKNYMSAVRTAIMKDLRLDASTRLVAADGLLLPRETDMSDETQVNKIIKVAVSAVQSETLVFSSNSLGLPITDFIEGKGKGNTYFSLGVKFNNPNVVQYDAVGSPIRRDIELKVSTRSINNNVRSVNTGSSDEEILTVGGYIDFKFNPAYRVNPFMMQQQQVNQVAPFVPVFVITSIEPGPRALMTSSLVSLAIATVPALAQNQYWAQYFLERSNISAKELNFSDIGLLNIEANIGGEEKGYGTPFDIRGKDVGPTNLIKYITQVAAPTLMVAIDVPAAGPDTWFLSMFAHAFNSDKSAIDRVFGGVSTLIDKTFTTNEPIFLKDSNIVQGGYFTEKGERYDLRVAESYLGVAALVNATNTSPAILSDYQRTFESTGIEAPLRAAERLEILGNLGIKPTIKQTINRLIFNPGFINSVTQALVEHNFVLRPETNSFIPMETGFGNNNVDYSVYGLNGNVQVTGYNQTYGGSYNQIFNPYNRWY